MPRAGNAWWPVIMAGALLIGSSARAGDQVQVTLRDTEQRPVEAKVVVEYVIIGANISGGSKPKPHDTQKGIVTILCAESETMFTMVEVHLPEHSLYFFDTSQGKRRCTPPIMEFVVNINRRRDISKVDAPGTGHDLSKIENATVRPHLAR